MLVHDQQVRLTPREQRVLYRLSGKDPSGIRTRADVRRFARMHLKSAAQDPEKTRQLKHFLNRYLAAL